MLLTPLLMVNYRRGECKKSDLKRKEDKQLSRSASDGAQSCSEIAQIID